MAHATWVFDCDAPLDQFRQRLVRALRRDGWDLMPAQVYDLGCQRRGVRAWLRLRHHDWGVEVRVKVKAGLLGGAGATQEAERALWSAARTAQQALASTPPPGRDAAPSGAGGGATGDAPEGQPEPGAPAPDPRADTPP